MNQFVKQIANGRTIKTLFRRNGKYYVASNNGKETLVFESNSKGEISNYTQIIEPWALIDSSDDLFSWAIYRMYGCICALFICYNIIAPLGGQ